MTPDTTIKRMSSRDFFRNPAAAKKEAENTPLIINEYGEAAFVFLPFAQYESLLQGNTDLVPLPAPISAEESPEKASANAEMAILSDNLSDGFLVYMKGYICSAQTSIKSWKQWIIFSKI